MAQQQSDNQMITLEQTELLLHEIYNRYGHNMQNYEQNFAQRSIIKMMEKHKKQTYEEFANYLLRDETLIQEMFGMFLINVSWMFRDPTVFEKIRNEIIPQLASYPVIKIWSAGCATGEEAYSLAILLHEANLLKRSIIYATDADPYVLSIAKEGRYNLTGLTKSIENYYLSGGKEKFSDYYTIDFNGAFFDPKLSRNICFAEHNLITDAPFNEFQLILCRNVFIYFDTHLQTASLIKFQDSLEGGGFFVSGKQEYLENAGINRYFQPYDSENKIYKKGLQ